jgi:hypothetical protein
MIPTKTREGRSGKSGKAGQALKHQFDRTGITEKAYTSNVKDNQ